MSDGPETSTTSVGNVQPVYRLGLENVVPELARVKCTTCNEVTDTQWLKIQPRPDGLQDVDPLELMKLGKRLTMCTVCGTVRLTK